jgi:hypothetical protein
MHGSPNKLHQFHLCRCQAVSELKRIGEKRQSLLPEQGNFIPVAVKSAPTMLVTDDMAKVSHR